MSKEIPILMITPMVQAILAGRKTMTRRLVGKYKYHEEYRRAKIIYDAVVADPDSDDLKEKLFKGACVEFDEGEWIIKSKWNIGDFIWVRESHYGFGSWKKNGFTKNGKQKWRFHYDAGFPNFRYTDEPPFKVEKNTHRLLGWYKRSSLFMPKRFARIWLEVTDIRVERLNEITEADAIAEGIEPDAKGGYKSYEIIHDGKYKGQNHPHSAVPNISAIYSFKELWESLNGEESWEENHWVWCVSFKVLSTTGRPQL